MGLIKWIQCGNDCENCQFCWEERPSYDGDDYDAGCYIKGACYDDEPCHLINPVRFIIGTLAKRKATYYFMHEYDSFPEYWEERCKKTDKMQETIKENLFKGLVLGHKNDCGEFEETDIQALLQNNVDTLVDEYENYIHPYNKLTLRTEWKNVITKTFKAIYARTIGKIKPYISKKVYKPFF